MIDLMILAGACYLWLGFAGVYLMRKVLNQNDSPMALWLLVLMWPIVWALVAFLFVLAAPKLFAEAVVKIK